jgi:hypothetical protein
MTLRERIEARLALAEAATPGPWFIDAPDHLFVGNRGDGRTYGLWEIVYSTGDAMPDLVPEAQGRARANAAFIADRSPDRVIAECRADLALLDAIRARNRQVRLGINGVDLAILAAANLDNRYPEGEDA